MQIDREVVRLLGHLDQTRAAVREALLKMSEGDRVALFKTCASGKLAEFDEPAALLVGMLAMLAIYDLHHDRQGDGPEGG